MIHFDDFFILVTSKTKAFKVITSNIRNPKGILTFTLQIFLVLFYWTMSYLCRHITVYILTTSSYLLPLLPRPSRSLLQTQEEPQELIQRLPYRYFWFWFIGQCHSFADMVQYILTTSSYLLPLKTKAFKVTTLNTRNLENPWF